MYLKLAFIMCVVSFIYCIIRKQWNLHPLFIFNLIWFGILKFESYHLFGLYTSEKKIYNLIVIGIFAFNVGFYIWDSIRRKYRFSFNKKNNFLGVDDYSFVPRYNLLYILAIICIVYYMNSAFSALKALFSGNSLGDLRLLVQSATINNTSFFSKLINFISVIVIIPSSYVIQLVGAMDFWIGKKDKKLFLASIFLALISSLSEGGRTSVVNYLIYMLLGYLFSTLHLKKSGVIDIFSIRKRKKLITIVVIIFILFLGWFTASRTGQTLQKNLYLYFSMQPYMFNLWANRVDSLHLYGFGEASLNGFSFSVLYIFKNLFNLDFPVHWKSIYDIIRLTDSEWQVITTSSTTANAYVSSFWFFYLDARAFGIIIGMFSYGVYIAHSFNEVIKKTNIKTLSLYGFIFQGMIYTFIRFPFSNIYYSIAYIIIVLLIFKKEKQGD